MSVVGDLENVLIPTHHTMRKVFCFRFLFFEYILGDPGADSGGERKSKRAENIHGTKKSKERREIFLPI